MGPLAGRAIHLSICLTLTRALLTGGAGALFALRTGTFSFCAGVAGRTYIIIFTFLPFAEGHFTYALALIFTFKLPYTFAAKHLPLIVRDGFLGTFTQRALLGFAGMAPTLLRAAFWFNQR